MNPTTPWPLLDPLQRSLVTQKAFALASRFPDIVCELLSPLESRGCLPPQEAYVTRGGLAAPYLQPPWEDPIVQPPPPVVQQPPVRRRGRPPGTDRETWTWEQLLGLVAKGRDEAAKRFDDPTLDDIASECGWSRRTLDRAAKRHGHTLKTTLEFLSTAP